jgi:hypothetical protein
MIAFALIGSKALWLLYAWLASAAVSGYVSERKGYGERIGLACGLLLFVLGPLIWVVVPAREESKWRTAGIIGSRTKRDRMAEAGRDRSGDSAGP